MYDREHDLKLRRDDLLQNMEAAEREHNENWQLAIIDELSAIDDELDKLYDEATRDESE